jgi:predicted DNA-binding transcriptional regulator
MKKSYSDHATSLQSFGLSKNEARLYHSLVTKKTSTVTEMFKETGIHRRNIYDSLERLLEKGLLFEVLESKENTYEAVHPQKLMEILREREEQLAPTITDLTELYEAEQQTDAAFIYKGIEGYKNYMRDLIRVGEPVYFLGAKALWFTPGISTSFLKSFQTEMKHKNKGYKTLFDPRVPIELPEAMKKVGGEYKILPKGAETVGVMDVFGDHIVSFTSAGVGNFGEDGKIFVTINRDLADSYRTWFDLIWNGIK